MLALLGVSGLSWIALLSGQLSWPGPTYRDPYLSGVALGVLALVGLVVFILAGFVRKSQAELAPMRMQAGAPYGGPSSHIGRCPPASDPAATPCRARCLSSATATSMKNPRPREALRSQ